MEAETERRFPFGAAWILFLAALFGGAGLMLSEESHLRWAGLGLVLFPILVFGLLLAAFYVKSRMEA